MLRELDAAFECIEQAVLPTVASMLDALIDAAAGARPGIDADAYASELRALAEQVRAATEALEKAGIDGRSADRFLAPGHADAA